MVCRVAAEMDESGVTVLGSFTPLAYAAYMLAKMTHAKGAYLVGFNAIGIRPLQLSFTGAEPACYKGAVARWSFVETINTVHLGGRGVLECVSPAQIDGSGAINVSVIGDYQRPKVRLPGGAGAPEVVQYYRRFVAYFGRHDRQVLVDKVDFATGRRSPVSASARRAAGLLEGPITIVTPLAVLIKDEDDKPFRISTLHPGADAGDVVDRTGFPLECPPNIPITDTPTPTQVRLLRDDIDPNGTVRFDFLSGEERRRYLDRILSLEWEAATSAMRASTNPG